MAIGFTVTNIATNVVPDRSLNKTSAPAIRTAKFGDGYEQRVVDGINNIKESFSITLANRDKVESDDISAFFDSKGGATAFNFTIPDTNSTSVTTGVTTTNTVGSASTGLSLSAANPDISFGSVVTGTGISGTVTVTAVSGTAITLSSAQEVQNNVTLTFTNQNERTVKVVCEQWSQNYVSTNNYSIQAQFRRVYEP